MTNMTNLTFSDRRVQELDGFEVMLDEAKQRVDVVLNRLPLNVIEMTQRDQLRPARCQKPVIAANRGYCFGVGFEISLACDFRIASDTCLYALPEQRLGQIPGSGGSARLQKIVGITRAKDIVMRSKRIGARQALDWGIVTECIAYSELEKTTDALMTSF